MLVLIKNITILIIRKVLGNQKRIITIWSAIKFVIIIIVCIDLIIIVYHNKRYYYYFDDSNNRNLTCVYTFVLGEYTIPKNCARQIDIYIYMDF